MLPTLSILVPTLSHRNSKPLLEELAKQCRYTGDLAEVLTESDDGSLPSGVKRQRLLNRSRGDYVCCLDDDDWVSEDYVGSLVSACLTGVSVVTFELILKRPDRAPESWHYRLGPDNRREGFMSANHLCAWQRDLATLVGWCPHLGYGDDQLWYKPLRAADSKLRFTEYHIPEFIYEYRYHPCGTAQQTRHSLQSSRSYAAHGLRCFWHNGKIVVESGNRRRMFGSIGVINAKGEDVLVNAAELEEFCVINIQ